MLRTHAGEEGDGLGRLLSTASCTVQGVRWLWCTRGESRLKSSLMLSKVRAMHYIWGLTADVAASSCSSNTLFRASSVLAAATGRSARAAPQASLPGPRLGLRGGVNGRLTHLECAPRFVIFAGMHIAVPSGKGLRPGAICEACCPVCNAVLAISAAARGCLSASTPT